MIRTKLRAGALPAALLLLASGCGKAATGPVVHAHDFPSTNSAGVTVSMELGEPGPDPAARLEKVDAAMERRFGRAQPGQPVQTNQAGGYVTAILSRRYTADPNTVHLFMTTDRNDGVCHVRAPVSPASILAFRGAIKPCADEIAMASPSAGGARAMPAASDSPPAPSGPAGGGKGVWAKVDGVYFHVTYITGVGGMPYPDYEPVVLFRDGSYYEVQDKAIEDMDLAADRALHPKYWGRWTRSGTNFTLTGSDGKPDTYPLQQGRFFKAFPARAGERIEAKYERVSGGGNSALGGEMTIANSSKMAFHGDGTFDDGRSFGAIGSGDVSGVGTSTAASRGGRGHYALSDFTMTLTRPDGRQERRFFAFGSHKNPPLIDREMVFLGGSVYSHDTD